MKNLIIILLVSVFAISSCQEAGNCKPMPIPIPIPVPQECPQAEPAQCPVPQECTECQECAVCEEAKTCPAEVICEEKVCPPQIVCEEPAPEPTPAPEPQPEPTPAPEPEEMSLIGKSFTYDLPTKLTSYKTYVVVLDLFDVKKSFLAELQAQDKFVICYFSAGSYEAWRSDAGNFPKAALGSQMDGWDERWIDVRNKDLRLLMKKRIELAKAKGCKALEFDNVDGWSNNTGFNLSKSDSSSYLKYLANETHKLGLKAFHKNNVEQVKQHVQYFDGAIVEECLKYNECAPYAEFIKAGKPVFAVEYSTMNTTKCDKLKALKFSRTFSNYALTKFYWCK